MVHVLEAILNTSTIYSRVKSLSLHEKIRSWMENELVTTVQPPVKANCQLLKVGNRTEQERVLSELKNWTNRETIDEFYTKAQR